MAFPTIPTVAASRVLTAVQANTTATRTFPSLSSLTKNAGDLLIAIVIAYQSSVTDAAFSAWGGGFTEFHDSSTSTTMAIGIAYKWSTGSETGTFTVTQAATITGHAVMILLSIPGAHATTPPEAGSRVSGTSAAADPGAFDPAGWAAEDTLWIAVGGSGETGTGGSFTGTGSAPANYSDYAETAISGDVVGGTQAAVAFRQLNAASEDVGTFTLDVSNARNAAVVIAIRPVAATPTRGLWSKVETEVPLVPTRGRWSKMEVEVPLVPTRGRWSKIEVEAPSVPTRGRFSFVEFEVPNSGPQPTRGLWSKAEFEVPNVPTRGLWSKAEVEVPIAPTRGLWSFLAVEVPSVGGESYEHGSGLRGRSGLLTSVAARSSRVGGGRR